MCFGDFNNLLSINDKKGAAVYLTIWLDGFRDCVSDCNLLEVPLLLGNGVGEPVLLSWKGLIGLL